MDFVNDDDEGYEVAMYRDDEMTCVVNETDSAEKKGQWNQEKGFGDVEMKEVGWELVNG